LETRAIVYVGIEEVHGEKIRFSREGVESDAILYLLETLGRYSIFIASLRLKSSQYIIPSLFRLKSRQHRCKRVVDFLFLVCHLVHRLRALPMRNHTRFIDARDG